MPSPSPNESKPNSAEPTPRALLYQVSLAGIPLGFAGCLLGLSLGSYGLAAGGLATAALSAFLWGDDQHPDHPSG